MHFVVYFKAVLQWLLLWFFFSVLGNNLIFVLKLDECQIIKGRRLERMSITLMNEAIVCAKRVDAGVQSNFPSFSVQSEKDIWWLGAFEVPKETHEVLAWMFARIPWITEVIHTQLAGEKLDVEGFGTFDVEWHLGGDLKTIKCFLGCKQGANSLYPCPFCTRGYKKQGKSSRNTKAGKKGQSLRIEEDVEVEEEGASDSVRREWDTSVLACPMLDEPDRASKDENWNPIIDFPLSNVHFCTLHAFMRIFDRLLKLHIDYAFTMKPMERSKEALAKVEDLLNSIGCHGGNVSIVTKKNGPDSHEIAQQVSMSGAKARHFLQKPLAKKTTHALSATTREEHWELWKELCRCTTDSDPNPVLVNRRKQVWACYDKMVKLMMLTSTTEDQRRRFQNHLTEFTTAVTIAWGETNITHYMVIIYSSMLCCGTVTYTNYILIA
jgi:hypothetical protein